MLQAVKHIVDCGERLQLDISLDLSVGRKCQTLRHILARTDEGTPDRDAVRDHGTGKSPGGNPTKTQVPRLRVIAMP
jgi:hypothetical protein